MEQYDSCGYKVLRHSKNRPSLPEYPLIRTVSLKNLFYIEYAAVTISIERVDAAYVVHRVLRRSWVISAVGASKTEQYTR